MHRHSRLHAIAVDLSLHKSEDTELIAVMGADDAGCFSFAGSSFAKIDEHTCTKHRMANSL